MQRSGPDLDFIRSVVLLVAAVIGLFSVLLNIVQSHAKEAPTPEAKREIYRGALSWFGTVLWAGSVPALFFFGASAEFTFYLWVPAYILECGLFLTSKNSGRLRVEILRLVVSAQALVFMGLMAYASEFLFLLNRLLRVVGGK